MYAIILRNAQMTTELCATSSGNTLTEGVEYNIKITKRKQKDNIIEMNSYSTPTGAIALPGEVDQGPLVAALPQENVLCAKAHSTPPPTNLITEDLVVKCYTQLFRNDERNYKLKVRLNLTDDTDADFIAKLTQDRRNFRKYLPEGCEDWFVEWSDCQWRSVKEQLDTKAYRGKFHQAQAYQQGRKVLTQVEPWCQCVVWFNPELRQWQSVINLYEFSIFQTLSTDTITKAQQRNNLHCQDIWLNAKYDQRIRPKTWAEQRMAKK